MEGVVAEGIRSQPDKVYVICQRSAKRRTQEGKLGPDVQCGYIGHAVLAGNRLVGPRFETSTRLKPKYAESFE